jgi:transposase
VLRRPGHAHLSQRTYICPGPGLGLGDRDVFQGRSGAGRAQAKLTPWANWWVIGQLRRGHASIPGLARRPGEDWHTVWDAVCPVLADLAGDED